MQRRPFEQQADQPVRVPLGAPIIEAPSRAGRIAGAAALVLALACALSPMAPPLRAALALVCVAIAMISARAFAKRSRIARGYIVIDGRGVSRVDAAGDAPLASWSEPFGLSVLAHPSRTRAVLAFTSPTRTRYVGVRVTDGDGPSAVDALFARGASVPAAEVDEVLGRTDATLTAAAANDVVDKLADRAGAALERIYLTDARGQAVVLDGGKLRLGERTIDLRSPLEWRGFTFHESSGQVAAFFQATWVRQDGAEAVLVAPLPADAARPTDARTRRILQWTPEAPPPKELRVAIDRLFMLPLRSALDRAPRISRYPSSGPRPLSDRA